MKKKILGIIPARGGSKGVIRKNIRQVGGNPLIFWAIKGAKESELLSSWVVSTDDDEIKGVAQELQANVMVRPENLASDKTPMIDVLQYICKTLEDSKDFYDYICLLQPTAPMRTSKCIDEAISTIVKNNHDSLVSLYKVDDCHPSRMYKIEENSLKPIFKEPKGSLRQDLEDVFHRNGAIYICTRDLLMNEGKLLCNNPIPFIMTKSESINIDDEQDLVIANHLMYLRENENTDC